MLRTIAVDAKVNTDFTLGKYSLRTIAVDAKVKYTPNLLFDELIIYSVTDMID